MAEPIPSASNDPEDPPAATNAEDRKAAAALDALNAKSMSQENGDSSGAKQPTAADQEALGKAMARLEGVVGGGKSGTAGKKVDSGKGEGKVVTAASTAREKRKEEEAARRKIKVDVGDVQFLVSEVS